MNMTKEQARHALYCLQQGERYPYDATDEWKATTNYEDDAPPAEDWAHGAARGVVVDLKDRRGIKHGFDNVGEEVRQDIVAAIRRIILLAHASTMGGA
jgi:hypothetical protein